MAKFTHGVFKSNISAFCSKLQLSDEPFEISALRDAISKNSILQGDADGIDNIDFDAHAEVIIKAKTSGELQKLPRRTLAVGAHLLWHPEYDFYQDREVLNFYYERMQESVGKPLLRTIARSLLMYWRNDLNEFDRFADYANKLIIYKHSGWLSQIINEDLLKGEAAMKKLASKTLESASNPLSVLEEAGLSFSLITSAYGERVFYHMCNQLARHPFLPGYESLFALYKSETGPRFDAQRADVIRACLRPWLTQSPPPEIKAYLLETLKYEFKDPRLSRKNWIGSDDRDLSVFLKWLAGESLELFLDIVDKTAVDRMWRFRRPFWKAYFDRDLISEAWVVFGSNAQGVYRNANLFRLNRLGREFGHLSGGEPGHSVLLMKMGHITIAEWSHNGKVWIWQPGESGSPSPILYRTNYHKEDCRGAEAFQYSQSHTSADRYLWQRRVSEKIRQLTGVRMPQRHFVPKP